MKRLAACVLALLAACTVRAQAPVQPADAGAERARIRSERAAVDARFASEQRACRAKFAVNDCMQKARRAHNEALADLRRQEIVLNDAERRRHAADRMREIEERNSPQKREQAEARRREAEAQQREREQRAAEKAAERAARAASAPHEAASAGAKPARHAAQGHARKPEPAKPNGPSADEAARNRQAYEQRLREAEEHKAQVRARAAKRGKPAAPPLPVPEEVKKEAAGAAAR